MKECDLEADTKPKQIHSKRALMNSTRRSRRLENNREKVVDENLDTNGSVKSKSNEDTKLLYVYLPELASINIESSGVKSYCNKRKVYGSSYESFALPDDPIFPTISNKTDKILRKNPLDTNVASPSDLSVLDLSYIDQPWLVINPEVITHHPSLDVLVPFDEIRVKEAAIMHKFRRSRSQSTGSIDTRSEQACIFTSTPFKARASNVSVVSRISISKNDNKTNPDISALKSSLEKILGDAIKSESSIGNVDMKIELIKTDQTKEEKVPKEEMPSEDDFLAKCYDISSLFSSSSSFEVANSEDDKNKELQCEGISSTHENGILRRSKYNYIEIVPSLKRKANFTGANGQHFLLSKFMPKQVVTSKPEPFAADNLSQSVSQEFSSLTNEELPLEATVKDKKRSRQRQEGSRRSLRLAAKPTADEGSQPLAVLEQSNFGSGVDENSNSSLEGSCSHSILNNTDEIQKDFQHCSTEVSKTKRNVLRKSFKVNKQQRVTIDSHKVEPSLQVSDNHHPILNGETSENNRCEIVHLVKTSATVDDLSVSQDCQQIQPVRKSLRSNMRPLLDLPKSLGTIVGQQYPISDTQKVQEVSHKNMKGVMKVDGAGTSVQEQKPNSNTSKEVTNKKNNKCLNVFSNRELSHVPLKPSFEENKINSSDNGGENDTQRETRLGRKRRSFKEFQLENFNKEGSSSVNDSTTGLTPKKANRKYSLKNDLNVSISPNAKANLHLDKSLIVDTKSITYQKFNINVFSLKKQTQVFEDTKFTVPDIELKHKKPNVGKSDTNSEGEISNFEKDRRDKLIESPGSVKKDKSNQKVNHFIPKRRTLASEEPKLDKRPDSNDIEKCPLNNVISKKSLKNLNQDCDTSNSEFEEVGKNTINKSGGVEKSRSNKEEIKFDLLSPRQKLQVVEDNTLAMGDRYSGLKYKIPNVANSGTNSKSDNLNFDDHKRDKPIKSPYGVKKDKSNQKVNNFIPRRRTRAYEKPKLNKTPDSNDIEKGSLNNINDGALATKNSKKGSRDFDTSVSSNSEFEELVKNTPENYSHVEKGRNSKEEMKLDVFSPRNLWESLSENNPNVALNNADINTNGEKSKADFFSSKKRSRRKGVSEDFKLDTSPSFDSSIVLKKGEKVDLEKINVKYTADNGRKQLKTKEFSENQEQTNIPNSAGKGNEQSIKVTPNKREFSKNVNSSLNEEEIENGILSQIKIVISPMNMRKAEKKNHIPLDTSSVDMEFENKNRILLETSSMEAGVLEPTSASISGEERNTKEAESFAQPLENVKVPKGDIHEKTVKQESTVKSGCDYKAGSFVWAQLGKYPFWPAFICQDPTLGVYKRIEVLAKQTRRYYHIRFFNDFGRRAWITAHHLMPYTCRDDLEILIKAQKQVRNLASLKSYRVPLNHLEKWKIAVDQLEAYRDKSYKETMSYLLTCAAMKKSQVQRRSEVSIGALKSPEQLATKKFKKDIDPNLETVVKLEILESQDDALCSDLNFTQCDLSKEVETPQIKVEEKVVAIDDDSESIVSRVKSEISEPSVKIKTEIVDDPNKYSFEYQMELHRKNNLFNGLTKTKVCQYCLKGGIIYKCKGKCCGFFHQDCASKVTTPQTQPKRGRKRKIYETSTTDQSRTATRKSPNNNNESPATAGREDQVQIVHVRSKLRIGTPKKTLPLNFHEMSLAERIDYQMKAVMSSFENRTSYAVDSSTDSSSEEGSVVISREKQKVDSFEAGTIGKVGKVFNGDNGFDEKGLDDIITQTKVIRHVTADSVIIEEELDTSNFKCAYCKINQDPPCFICGLETSKRGVANRQKCSLHHCGKYYHTHCLKMWPQTQWSFSKWARDQKNEDLFTCPAHICHTCFSEELGSGNSSRFPVDKLARCLRCPAAFHTSSFCVPAGTEVLGGSQIVCPRHRNHSQPLNTTWCFICSEGGNLVCCDMCPTSVHPECQPVNFTDDDKYICEDCESGRFPLYDEIVWVKLGAYQWWPALILFPNDVPENVRILKHQRGDFAVRFFGTHDHSWVSKARAFLFQEGDRGASPGQVIKSKRSAYETFEKAITDATLAYKLKKEFKLRREAEGINSLKPPSYIKINKNKPVGNVRLVEMDLSNTTACGCDPSKPHPCGPDSDCINRLLMTECDPEVCPAGNQCHNQSFEKREYPPLVPYKTQGRGWGLKCLAPIKKGQFVIEYVGELIDSEEYQRRIKKMHEQKEENYYFMTINNDRMIDAGPKGNLSRFMNHSCNPNCETQKWTVKGDTRVGLFAIKDVESGSEITFNYNLECVGQKKKQCKCGADNCSGFIGVKAKSDPLPLVPNARKPIKKKVEPPPVIIPPCFLCGAEKSDLVCHNKTCNRTYHLACLSLTDAPEGGKFICQRHKCKICSNRTTRCCVKCMNSYCPTHSNGNVRHDKLLGFVCREHDPLLIKSELTPGKGETLKRSLLENSSSATDDEAPLIDRLEKGRRKKLKSEVVPVPKFNGAITLSAKLAPKVSKKKKKNKAIKNAKM